MSVHFTEEWARKYEQRTGKKVHGLSNPIKQGKPKKSKYGNVKTVVDGIKFDSKKEAERYKILVLYQKAKLIKDLKLQVVFPLLPKTHIQRATSYIADFTYVDVVKNELAVEDAKGYLTREYKKKKRLMAKIYGIEIREV